MANGTIILDYQIQPSRLRRHRRLIAVVVSALLLAASWWGSGLYYSLEEPFFGDWRWDHAFAFSAAPLMLVGAYALWIGAVVVFVRPVRLAVGLLVVVAPLAAVAARDTLDTRAGYAADRARAAAWAAGQD